jgi:hypothetical protein
VAPLYVVFSRLDVVEHDLLYMSNARATGTLCTLRTFGTFGTLGTLLHPAHLGHQRRVLSHSFHFRATREV